MAKKVVIVLAEGFEEIEAISIVDILRRAGAEVTVAALDELRVQGSHGITVLADIKLENADLDFDACVFPGGMPGATHLSVSKEVQALIQKMNKEKKVIAAICASPALVLPSTGILKDKNATCYPGMQTHFGQDTSYKTDNVVIDRNVITSRGPATAIMFSLAIVEKLIGRETAKKVKKAILVS